MDTTQMVNWVHSSDQKCSYSSVYGSQPKRIGRMQRKAVMLLCYGASIRTAVKASGLSLRCVKVLYKQLRRY